jgi:hypothetical protein
LSFGRPGACPKRRTPPTTPCTRLSAPFGRRSPTPSPRRPRAATRLLSCSGPARSRSGPDHSPPLGRATCRGRRAAIQRRRRRGKGPHLSAGPQCARRPSRQPGRWPETRSSRRAWRRLQRAGWRRWGRCRSAEGRAKGARRRGRPTREATGAAPRSGLPPQWGLLEDTYTARHKQSLPQTDPPKKNLL